MYSDNIYPLNLDKLYLNYKKKNKPICLNLCYKNIGNFKFIKSKLKYSQTRNKNFNYVEIGYSIFNKKILNKIPNKNYNLNYFLNYMIKKKSGIIF